MIYSTNTAKTYNRPSYFVHVEGLPYLWFTKVPENWTAPTDWTYSPGLMLLPGEETAEIAQDLDPLGGVQDPETVSLQINDSEFLAQLGGTARGVKGLTSALLVTNDVDPNDDSDLETDVAISCAPVGTLLDDQFSDASIGADWTEQPGNGSISEAGGVLELYGNLPAGTSWNVGGNNAPVLYLDMASMRTTSEALFRAETEITDWAGGYTDRAGIALFDDAANTYQAHIDHSTGHVWKTTAVANVWANSYGDVGSATSTVKLRLYWNTHSTVTFDIEDGDTLAPGKAAIYYSQDGGAWTEYLSAAAFNIDGDYIGLFTACTATTSGADFAYFTVTETSVDGAPRLIYIGNQTISYAKRDGVDFEGVDRGRFHGLDSDLAEVEHKPGIKWSAKLDVAPWVTTFPRTITGRVVTLYRIYLDAEGNGPTDKGEHAIRFRGPISAHGDSDDHLGMVITCTGLIDLLDAEVYSDPESAPLKGYHFTPHNYVSPIDAGKTYIRLEETFWTLAGATSGQFGSTYATTIEILATRKVETPNELAKAINDELVSAWNSGTGVWPNRTLAPWKCWPTADGRILFGHEAVGYDSSGGLLLKGGSYTYTDLQSGIQGAVYVNDALSALGFGAPDGRKLVVGKCSEEQYRDAFARWTNPAAGVFSTFLIAGNTYRAICEYSSSEAARAWFRLDSCVGIPCEFPSTHEFVETPGDGSKFYVRVEDQLIYNAAAVDHSTQEIWLDSNVGARANFTTPIGRRLPPEDSVVSVPARKSKEDIPTVSQAWIPSCEQNLDLGAYYFLRKGVEHMLLHLMLSTGEGAGYNSDWDRLPRDWALGIPESYVDTASFERLGDAFGYAARQREYIFTEGRNFRALLEEECQTLGFVVVVINGKITAVPSKGATVANAVATIDNSARILDGEGHYEAAFQTAPEGIVNAIKLHFGYDVFEGEFFRHFEEVDLASQADHRTIQALEIENRGVRPKDWWKTTETISDITSMIWDRLGDWSQETYIYTCAINRSMDALSVGDVVLVTDALVPNPLTGTRGITGHPGVVQAHRFDDLEGRGEVVVRLSYQNSGLFTIPSITPFNAGNLAYGSSVTGGGEGKTLTLSPGTFQQQTTADPPAAGDLMKVQDVETGQAYEFEVISYNSTTNEVTMDRAVSWAGDDGVDRVVTWTKFTRAKAGSAAGREFKGAYLADADGELDGEQGYRLL